MKTTAYLAKTPDEYGKIHYTASEHKVWQTLIERQTPALKNAACDLYVSALEWMSFPQSRIPQCDEVSEKIQKNSDWSVTPVPALISFDRFFNLLANKKFPVASFIRRAEELDYLQEPDIFHEVFGHTPLLTDPKFAHFTHTYGLAGVDATREERAMLARLYWFSVEFGLIETTNGNRAYGAGLVSSIGELQHALSDKPIVKAFDLLEVLRTPYRIDIYQPIYFVIESFDQLFDLSLSEVKLAIKSAKEMGMEEPLFAMN
ncbi:MAG: phenylalanine 4-monooxygenase [Gammaproteobacteria bacterium]